jgi:hypothetical protein
MLAIYILVTIFAVCAIFAICTVVAVLTIHTVFTPITMVNTFHILLYLIKIAGVRPLYSPH